MKQLAIAWLLSMSLSAQTFEVASVKPHDPAVRGQGLPYATCRDGRFEAITGPLSGIIYMAYGLNTLQLLELNQRLPRWALSVAESYDVEATYSGQVSDDECRQMVQNLLVQRFKFVSHWQAGTGTVYNLVVARGGVKIPMVQDSDPSRGVYITVNGRLGQYSPRVPVPRGLTMDNLTKLLEGGLNTLDRIPVINKTGLEGLYKITLAYSREAAADQPFADPDLFNAIQQQLGLKLEKAQGPISQFIVDHLEMPDEN